MSTSPESWEWLAWDLKRSNLLLPSQVEHLLAAFSRAGHESTAAEFASFLVAQGQLTEFQADRLLRGVGHELHLDRFVLCDVLSAGVFGTVYLGRSPDAATPLAVRVLPRSTRWNLRFVPHYVRALAELPDMALVPLQAGGGHANRQYLVWPRVEGRSLRTIIHEQGPLPVARVIQLTRRLAQALQVAHHANLAHGFVRPSAVLLTDDEQVRLVDFGIGSLWAETVGRPDEESWGLDSTFASCVDGVSPELVMNPGATGHWCDQYGLGVVAVYALTGTFPGEPRDGSWQKLVPESFVLLVRRLLQPDPKDRFPSMQSVTAALSA